ncbi:MAG: tRNA (adenosine(37)-N6)-dimethylallyltransferase MiaA [Bacteroidetes bacterium]|nr:tRNA (adenosine(37)-N6)-dimethylallyltransferase MiaA [Bacteroidota bacterium]
MVETFPITYPVIVLVGPTAIGKTALSLELAEMFECEIISMDSMQVYKHMDIGTAKVSVEERKKIPHHLIDIINPDDHYDAKSFVDDTLASLDKIHAKNKTPIITGGTGLYLTSLLEGLFDDIGEYPDIRQILRVRLDREGCSKLHHELSLCDCESANKIHKNDTHRVLRALEIYQGTGVPWSEHIRQQNRPSLMERFPNMLQIGLTCDRAQLYERINLRTRIMIQSGFIEEVSGLLMMGYGKDLKAMSSIGYRHAVNFIDKKWDEKEMETLLARDTRRYAKRQYTWFNKNKSLVWMDVSEPKEVIKFVTRWMGNL